MTTRILKESRELLPGLLATCALIAAPFLIWGREAGPFAYFGYCLGCVVMAGLSLGHEFHHRTIAVLLAQPVPRAQLWREKMVVLGLALLAMMLVMGTLTLLMPPQEDLRADGNWLGLVLVPLCAFCGAPWLTLTTRNPIAGTVASIGFPMAVMALAALMLAWFPQLREQGWIYAVLLLGYCATAYFLGRRAFRGFEAIEGGGRTIDSLDGLARLEGLRTVFVRGPFSSLVWKEVRLQQVTFLMAAVFTGLALVGAGLMLIRPDFGAPVLAVNFSTYIFMVPILAGAVGVAEERSLGVTDWHLALPPSTGKQWLAKAGVVILVSLVLGVALPLGLMEAGTSLLGRGPFHRELAWHVATLCVVVQVSVTALTLYASSLCRSTLKAIMVAFGLGAAVGICLRLVFLSLSWLANFLGIHFPAREQGQPEWTAIILSTVGLGAVLLWLGYLNFRGRSTAGGAAQVAGFLLLTAGVVLYLAF